MPPLTNQRHETFAQLITTGATANGAYVGAGYREHSSNAAALAALPSVQARIAEISRNNAAAAQVTAARVLAEIARIGFADIAGAVDIRNGEAIVRDMEEIPPDLRAAIAEIRQTRDGVAIKFHSKPEALTLLGKHLQLWSERLDVNVNVSLHDLVMGSYRIERGELAPPALELTAEEPDVASPTLPGDD